MLPRASAPYLLASPRSEASTILWGEKDLRIVLSERGSSNTEGGRVSQALMALTTGLRRPYPEGLGLILSVPGRPHRGPSMSPGSRTEEWGTPGPPGRAQLLAPPGLRPPGFPRGAI